MTFNYSFYAIPACWAVSLYPHLYAVCIFLFIEMASEIEMDADIYRQM